MRPTCEVNGLLSGYTGEGAKTVLPGQGDGEGELPSRPRSDAGRDRAPDARARRARRAAGRHGDGDAPSRRPPWRADLDGPLFDAARRALATAFEREPVITGEGGSIPVVGDFQRILGTPVLLVGFGLPGENAHAPNEWMSEENFNKGMRAMAALWDELSC